jgi:hypothetical protein
MTCAIEIRAGTIIECLLRTMETRTLRGLTTLRDRDGPESRDEHGENGMDDEWKIRKSQEMENQTLQVT